MESEFAGYEPTDRPVLEAAAAWLRTADRAELVGDWPRRLTAERGVDVATAALYLFVRRSDRLLDLAADPARAEGDEDRPFPLPFHLAVAPGAFYREHAGTGADGAAVREAARALGARASLIPAPSLGTLSANANAILEWLGRQQSGPLVLVSLSKGGADVKCALAAPQAAAAFRHVVAWINVGGITDGSGMASWLFDRSWATLIYRLLFWRRGRDFEFVRDLPRRPGGPLDFTPELPEWMTTIHVVGFPLRRHIRKRATRTWHRRLAKWGPNDGAAVLHDAFRLPGRIAPIWGVDHFSQDRLDLGRLVGRILRWLAAKSPETDPPALPEPRREPLGAAL